MQLLESGSFEPQKTRSPNFPVQGLGQAVENLKKVYEKDRTATTTREVIAIHLGYQGLNGSSKRVIASTMQYGLIEEAGQGKVKVSEVGEGILHPKDAAEKRELLVEALSRPKIYSDILRNFGPKLPSDATLEALLIREYKFAPVAAKTCIKSLRQSYSFIDGLDNNGDVSGNPEDAPSPKVQPEDANEKPVLQATNYAREHIEAPISASVRAEVYITGRMRPEDLDKFKSWLDRVVKPWAEFAVVDQE